MGERGRHGVWEKKVGAGMKWRILCSAIIVSAAVTLAASPSGAAYERPGETERASLTSDDLEAPQLGLATGAFFHSAVTPDGRYVVFDTYQPLSKEDTNIWLDIYLRDRLTHDTELISRTEHGLPAVYSLDGRVDHGSHHPVISANARYVAFVSDAENLVAGDTNRSGDVFIHDRSIGTTSRISVGPKGKQTTSSGPFLAHEISMTSNGRFVAFDSDSSELVAGDSNESFDVFVRDLRTKRTRRASVGSGSRQAVGGDSRHPSLSPDGRYVAFESKATNLDPSDTNDLGDVFVHDLETEDTELVSKASDGSPGMGAALLAGSGGRALSRDGRFVAFRAAAFSSNLVPSDSNSTSDVFVHDRKTHRTERVTVTSKGEEAGHSEFLRGATLSASIDSSGRFVVFDSAMNDLVEGDGGHSTEGDLSLPPPLDALDEGDFNIFRFDRWTGAIDMIDVANGGGHPAGCAKSYATSFYPQLSATGRFVSFASCAPNLVRGDNNDLAATSSGVDIFVRDLGLDLGFGGLGEAPQDVPNDAICISPDTCLPPGNLARARDLQKDVSDLTEYGADLYGASIAYRPQFKDLFAAIELGYMPKILSGISPIFYGLRFEVEDKTYEVRATSLLGGTFGLFDCTGSRPLCAKISDLRGGYGTTGMRVVFSLPLNEIGLENGGELSDVEAYSALGSYVSGPSEILDTVRLD